MIVPITNLNGSSLYLQIVGGLYTAIIFVLVGTNLHRFRKDHHAKEASFSKKFSTKIPCLSSGTSDISDEEAGSNPSHNERLIKKRVDKMPLLPDSQLDSEDCSEYVEAIDVKYTSDNKPKYSHSVIKGSDYMNNLLKSDQRDSDFNGERSASPNTDKISTTVVTSKDLLSSTQGQQFVRVGLTFEEEIKPKALLEMIGDDAAEPVSV